MIPLGVLASARVEAAGGAAFDPTSIAGLDLWLKADAITGLSHNDRVSSWPDSTAAGNHATQTDTTRQPLYYTNQINGLPTVFWEWSNNDYLTTAASASGAAQTMFAVFSDPGIVGQVNTLQGANNSGGLQLRAPSFRQGAVKQSVAEIGSGTSAYTTSGVAKVVILSFVASLTGSGGSVGFRLNGAANGGVSTTQTLTAGRTLQVGAAATGEYLLGGLAEMLHYSATLTATQCRSVEEYLSAKYAITLT